MDKCPDCNGELEKGCLLDHTYGLALVQRFAKAEIPVGNQKIIWGTREIDFTNVRRVITYRCTKCNRLFNYAQDSLAASNESLNSYRKLQKNTWVIALVVLSIFVITMGIVFLKIKLLVK